MNSLDDFEQNYRAKCEEDLDVLEKSLLAMETGGEQNDRDAVRVAIRAAHSVKSAAMLCDWSELAGLARGVEHALALVRRRRISTAPDHISALLNATDRLREMVEDPAVAGSPAVAAAAAALEELRRGAGGTPVPGAGRHRMRALIVEDEPTSRFLLETFLRRYGDCDVAGNGREAVERFRELTGQGRHYDLICMDIMMPEMDGAEALRQVRAVEDAEEVLPDDRVKVIMTTAVDTIQQVAQCFRDLCDAYLVKPIDLGKLLSHMKSYGLVTTQGHEEMQGLTI